MKDEPKPGEKPTDATPEQEPAEAAKSNNTEGDS
jgi:hypothetical protein